MIAPLAQRAQPGASRSGLQASQAPLPRRRRRAVPAAAKKQQQQRKPAQQQNGGKGFGGGGSGDAGQPEQQAEAGQQGAGAPSPAASQAPAAAAAAAVPASPATDGSAAALPAVGRGRILAVCTQVSVLVTAVAFALRQVAPAFAPAVADGQGATVKALLDWATLPSAAQLAAAAGTAAAVTAARTALLGVWPEFRASSDRSNRQVLAPLGAADVLVVAALPAISEELLFRGALIPAVYPDWRGVLIAGLAFGVLHNSGGRSPAFAAWASAVGCTYGALFLATGSIACPALAHSLANVASAALWRASSLDGGSSGGGSGDGSSGGSA